MTAELTAIDLNIRRYQNAANAHRDLAVHFGELAEEDGRMVNYWTAERAKYLGQVGLENVIPISRCSDDDLRSL